MSCHRDGACCLHGCWVTCGTHQKFLALSDHAAKTARLKIPHLQSTCKMEGKYILSIGLWNNYLQYGNTWIPLWTQLHLLGHVSTAHTNVLWSDSREKHQQKGWWSFLSLQWVGRQRAAWDAFTEAILRLSQYHPETLGQSWGLDSDFSRHSQ